MDNMFSYIIRPKLTSCESLSFFLDFALKLNLLSVSW